MNTNCSLLVSIYPSSHSYTISVWYSPSCGVCSDAAIKCGQSLMSNSLMPFGRLILLIFGEPLIGAYFNDECSWEDLKEQIKQQEQRWLRKAKKYLLYPEPLTRIK